MSEIFIDSPTEPLARFLFAHGAGAPMDSEFMQCFAQGLCERGVEVVRFEFPYMAQRRTGGSKRPPNTMPQLQQCFREQIQQYSQELPLFIGGKSMGGRVASLLADEYWQKEEIAGLVCLGYPFHPQGKPKKLRTEHLLELHCPTLVVQGDRDPLGNRQEVDSYGLSVAIDIEWLEDGDHDFKPRRASGFTRLQHWHKAVELAAQFMWPSQG
ncbi:alpha/beta hydrolase [Microbulbifer sp. OS29]|uniref:Alpha/beta hydrolase n=1 Tax=Microbulbifer okhotskensis TaxID=2926617 RepID=A0A9X2EQ21_9GAMM|nr:alpha/beta family hydrolase [Microbulbifer okhotskensis]MCO1335255.1 alpha/beta hydrolase [Microbulbifer okhotskensis]